jgi:BirA family biotin operon repressor/biotin-[acetyl-CoA-carboxylase] ligase
MLPPGIFLWESGLEGLCEPARLDDLAVVSPIWKEELERCGAWSESFETDSGRFVKADLKNETTIVIVGKCSSTMEVVRYLVESDMLPKWGAVIAVEQSSGRGQLRRPWVSSPGNLHVSAVLPEGPSEGDWAKQYSGLISLLCGHLIASGVKSLGAEVQIKWPNDLLHAERKVGGMLIEERAGVDILGLGINLMESPPDSKMREDRSVEADVLRTNPPIQGPLSLWRTLVSRGKSLYVILLGELKPSQFVSSLSGHLAWMGRTILVNEREGSTYQAEIIGISPEGGLLVRHAEGEEVLFSGSITPQ